MIAAVEIDALDRAVMGIVVRAHFRPVEPAVFAVDEDAVRAAAWALDNQLEVGSVDGGGENSPVIDIEEKQPFGLSGRGGRRPYFCFRHESILSRIGSAGRREKMMTLLDDSIIRLCILVEDLLQRSKDQEPRCRGSCQRVGGLLMP